MTARVAVSVPFTVAFVSAYRLLTTAPPAGIGPVSRLLIENPGPFGQKPQPFSSDSEELKLRHWPLDTPSELANVAIAALPAGPVAPVLPVAPLAPVGPVAPV